MTNENIIKCIKLIVWKVDGLLLGVHEGPTQEEWHLFHDLAEWHDRVTNAA